jgi:hypothetical protein
MHKKAVILSVFLLVFAVAGYSQITVTAPASKVKVKAAADYGAETLRDKMDMNERTDMGWRIFNTVEQYPSYLTNISFSGGIFSATSVYMPGGDATYSNCNITILDSYYPGSAPIGKFGKNFPINADKYTLFVVRMYLTPGVSTWPNSTLYWSKNTIFPGQLNGGVTRSNVFAVNGGWAYYIIDVPALGIWPIAGLRTDAWSGNIDSLRFDPIVEKDKTIKIDWIRIVEKDAATQKPITWTGGGNVDIYLDDNNNAGDGNLGLLAQNVGGGSYQFYAGALSAGNYYVAIAPTGTTTYSYSPGSYEVNDQPVLNFTKPSAEGSDQDFFTAVLGNPADMAAANDVDIALNITNNQFTTLNYESLAGQSFNGSTVFYGTSAAAAPGNVGDPQVYLIRSDVRGAGAQIDASKYHNLVFTMGLPGAHDTNGGSIARVIWKNKNEAVENVSEDLIVRSLPSVWIGHKFISDLRNLPLDPSSPSTSGWTGFMDNFRLDPHEFSSPKDFFIDDVKITADWQADASFEIKWNLTDADNNPTLTLYYDTTGSGYGGTSIVSSVVSPGNGTHTWNTSALPNGTYYIYAVVDDGTNSNRAYAGGPLIIKHSAGGTPTINLSKKNMVFGASQGGAATSAETSTLTNTGSGTLDWTASVSGGASWLQVTPTSGTGNAVLNVSITDTNKGVSTYTATITVQDPNASNSPQLINVTYNVYTGGLFDSPPFGSFDTPLDGQSGVTGSIAVTGWALDDVEVVSVKIYRDPVAGESPGPNGYVFIGNATFVKGARKDVEAAYPTFPRADRAGWGYMMLTNFMPNLGNGSYTLHALATDSTGHVVDLGQKTITCDNAHIVKPFGAIDTPTQGGPASGSTFAQFGWALTPQPKMIPVNGWTIQVFVDGLPIGNPAYGYYRGDVSTKFTGYKNTDGPVGVYTLNTTVYADGVHTIAWSVTDDGGATDGIGSRFFVIQNTGVRSSAGNGIAAGVAAGNENPKSVLLPGQATGTEGSGAGIGRSGQAAGSGQEGGVRSVPKRSYAEFSDLAGIPTDDVTPIMLGKGFDQRIAPQISYPDRTGARVVNIEEVSRIVLYLGGEMESGPPGSYGGQAYLIVGGELRELPIGSTFDADQGIFYWQPGPGFLGEFDFVFIKNAGGRQASKTLIKIVVGGQVSTLPLS